MPRSALLLVALFACAILSLWWTRSGASATGRVLTTDETPFTLSLESHYGEFVEPHNIPAWHGAHMTIDGEAGVWTNVMARAHVNLAALVPEENFEEGNEWTDFIQAFPILSNNLHQISIDPSAFAEMGSPFEAGTSESLTQDPAVVFDLLNNIWDDQVPVQKKFQPILEDSNGPLPRVWTAQCQTWEDYETSTGLTSAQSKWKSLVLLHELPPELTDQDEYHYFSIYSLMSQAIRDQTTLTETRNFFEQPTTFNSSLSWARWLIGTRRLKLSIQAIGLRQPWLLDFDWFVESLLPNINSAEIPPTLLLSPPIELAITIAAPVNGSGNQPPSSLPGRVASVRMDGYCAPFTISFHDAGGNSFTVNAGWKKPGHVEFRIPLTATPGPIAIFQIANPIETITLPVPIVPVIYNP